MGFIKVLFSIALSSLWNRRVPAFLTVLSIALSVVLLLGVERIRQSTRSSFESTVSGVDMIVGARGGTVNLLLYSVFRIGNATNNISQNTYHEIIANPNVEWAIPISLGDSHKGFKVVGTNDQYLSHYKYAGDKNLKLLKGQWNKELYDVVIGSKVAEELSYELGDQLVLSHGTDEAGFQGHDDHPFTVRGVLAPTGTPVDSSLHISLKAMTAIHLDWIEHDESAATSADQDADVTAVFIKLKSKMQVFNFQRYINEYKSEPLTAIMPGVSLSELWQTLGWIEKILVFIGGLIFIVSLLSMLIALLSTLNERRREMAILRAIGAGRTFVFMLLIVESLLLVIAGVVLGVFLLYMGLFLGRGPLETQFGLSLKLFTPSSLEIVYLALVFLSAMLISLIPAWQAYKNSLMDGLTIKV